MIISLSKSIISNILEPVCVSERRKLWFVCCLTIKQTYGRQGGQKYSS